MKQSTQHGSKLPSRTKVGAIINSRGIPSSLHSPTVIENASSRAQDKVPSKAVSTRNQKGVKEQLARIPRVTDTEFRLACSDIAEELAKSWSFLGRVFIAMGILAGAFIGVIGWTIHDMAREESDAAKNKIDAEIADQFKDERVKTLVEKAANEKAKELLQTYVQPGIDAFNQHLKDQAAAYDKEVADVKSEVDKLKARNEVTALADKAIGEGDVASYRALQKMTVDANASDAAQGEFMRVFDLFGPLGPTLNPKGDLNVSAIHPGKTKEDDLDSADLIPLLQNQNSFLRMKIADVLGKVGKVGSYSTAKAIVEAIRNEPSLWVLKHQKPTFAHIVNYKNVSFQDDGSTDSPDGQDVLDWWTKHEAEVRAQDSDSITRVPSK